MKTLSGIDAPLKELSGKDVQGVDGPLTIKSILTQCIGVFFTSPNAEENVQAYIMAQNFYKAEDIIELEDADFRLLEKAVKKVLQDQRYSPVVMAQLIQYIDSIKKNAKED